MTGPRRDLHSGHYGGSVQNPIQALVAVLATLHDAEGRVTVPGFYDDVLPMTDEERTALSGMQARFMDEWRTVTGAPQPWGEPEYLPHERVAARPTLEINGIGGGYAGEGFKTVLPARAIAKISCRLVPDQDPQQVYMALLAHLTPLVPPTVTVEIRPLEEGSPGFVLDRNTPAMRAAALAYEQAWGVAPIFWRDGGSIPVVTAFAEHLRTAIVMLPYGYKGGGAHSTNEHVYLAMFHKGIATTIAFCQQLAMQLP
ncbi:MAG: M20/M25/M40 family metallo-hydrolase [Armatimonadetes bacterium]|nr:M20/M25/M40 family metallo-hydrolase [Anaerolineae bacterium]